MPKTPILATYKNGFVARFNNKRIECLLREDGDYNVIFIRCSKDKFTNKHLKAFDKTIQRIKTTITYKVIILSEEALSILSEGFINYKQVCP